MSNDEARLIFTEHLEALLEPISPNEADLASVYVDKPEELDAVPRERLAGMPAGEVVMLVGPWVVKWLAPLTLMALEELRKKIASAAADQAWKWLKAFVGKMHHAPVVTTKEDSIERIAASLGTTGLPADKARWLAVRVWDQAKQTADRMALATGAGSA
jgi:hypothetical protein